MRETPPVLRYGAGGKPQRHIGISVAQIPSLRPQCPARCVHMSHRALTVIHSEHARCALGGKSQGNPVDNAPIETYSRCISESREELKSWNLKSHQLI